MWKDVIKKDPLYNNKKNQFFKNIDVKKAKKYFLKLKNKEGFFNASTPMYYTTYLCAGILFYCNQQISQKTVDFLKSCQSGNMGFAEMPGEIPWIDRTFYILKVFEWFDIPINDIKEISEYYIKFQNEDGGFQSTSSDISNLEDTYYAIEILRMLNKLEIEKEKCINWVLNYDGYQTIKDLYFVLKILKILNFNLPFSNSEKYKKIYKILSRGTKRKKFEDLFYCIECSQMLNLDIKKFQPSNDILNVEMKLENLEEIYFMAIVYQKYKMINMISTNLIDFVKKIEFPTGGFMSPREVSIFKNNKCIHSLFLLDGLNGIDRKKYIYWLRKSLINSGWGPIPNSKSSLDHYTRSSLTSYFLCRQNVEEKLKKIIEKKYREKLTNQYNNSSMRYLRQTREALEILMLLNSDYPISKLEKIIIFQNVVSKVKSFYKNDGGFGGKISFMYPTYLAIRSLYLIENFLKENYNIENLWKGNFKNRIKRWINSCQNNDGGFGTMPNQPSNIQATFYALYSLWMLNSKIKNVDKLTDWLRNHQNEDGGFSKNKNLVSDPLISFYIIASLKVIATI